jgi:pyruvate formate lyase activating enzyme
LTTGVVFDVHRASLHDGPGVRTAVFLKGCPLRCSWCHNAESQTPSPVLRYRPRDCTGCGGCATACPVGCHIVDKDGHRFDRTDCTDCGICVESCPTTALAMVGEEVGVDWVMTTVRRDRVAYAASGGGLTISGGEPLAQADFTAALLTAARGDGIHTCVETSGFANPAIIDRLAPLVDLWLWDCKAVDDGLHRRLTGVGNAGIIANLDRLLAGGAAVELRCPLIPGLNDGDADLAAMADFIRQRPALRKVWVMPYHRLGVAKAAECGAGTLDRPSATTAEKARWLERLGPTAALAE